MEIISGKIVKGAGLGKGFGFPTINIPYFGHLSGVFAGIVAMANKSYPAAINIGSRPTVDDKQNICEAFLLTWNSDENIPLGTTIEIELKEKIRDTKKFANFEDLKLQIAKDVEFVKTCYNL